MTDVTTETENPEDFAFTAENMDAAKAVIANVATNFTAYTFFNDKQGIAVAMQRYLNQKFTTQLYAQIEALQITQVELPNSFQEAILTSIATKQNITRSERYKENMQVTFQTQRMVAEQQANQTVITARGEANKKLQQANLQNRRLWWAEGKRWVNLRVTTRALKTIQKKGLGPYAKSLGINLAKL